MVLDGETTTAPDALADPSGEAEYTTQFHALFVAHHGALCGYAHRLLGDPQLARDVVQDVFVRLWERRHQWDTARGAAPYLYRAVRHRALDIVKHRGVVERHVEAERVPGLGAEAGGPDPEQELGAAELRAAVRVAVAALPAPQRDAFTLSRDGGLTYAEIAETLDVSVKTVEKRMGQAFRSLYTALAPHHAR